MASFQRCGRNPDSVEEGSGEDGEDEVEKEATIGLEAEDSGRGAEYRGREVLKVR